MYAPQCSLPIDVMLAIEELLNLFSHHGLSIRTTILAGYFLSGGWAVAGVCLQYLPIVTHTN